MTPSLHCKNIAPFGADAEAAVRQMASQEPGTGQMSAVGARKAILVLRKARPDITIKIRWCRAHKGVREYEKTDELANLAAEELEACRVQCRSYADRPGADVVALQTPRLPKAGDLGEETGGGPVMAWGLDPQKVLKTPRLDRTVAGRPKTLA